jgi:hypothetical protein
LGTLISSSGSITIGDKVFSDFGFSSATFNANSATVTASITPGGAYELKFQGPWVSFLNPAGDSLSLTYTVETTVPNARIASIGQAYVLSAAGTGGTISVEEKARQGSFAGSLAAQSTLSYVTGVPSALDLEDPIGEPSQSDQLSVTPLLSKIYVTTDINMTSTRRGGVGATTLVQSFNQVSVPEAGATVAMLGVGVLGIAAVRRKVS